MIVTLRNALHVKKIIVKKSIIQKNELSRIDLSKKEWDWMRIGGDRSKSEVS